VKRELALISQGMAREVVTHSGLLFEVSREVHARLPETIRQRADAILPELAQAAVAAATPDPAEARARLLEGLRQAFDDDARKLVTRAANSLLPELTADAVREAAPDPAKVHAEVVEAATLDLAELLRTRTADALATVVDRSTEQVRGAVAELVEQETRKLIPELARAAVTEATPDTEEVRAELVSGASGAVLKEVRAAVEDAAPQAVAAAVEAIRGSLADAVTTAVHEVLPNLARKAVDKFTPDIEELRELVTNHARISAAKAVEQETGKATAVAVKAAVADTVSQVRALIDSEQQKAYKAISEYADEAVDKKLAEFTPNIIMVTLPTGKQVKLGSDAHEILPELLVALHARCHVLLVGPAGTGKSVLAKHAALALDIPFQALSLGPTTPMSKVFGYYDAHGQYHDTPFRRAFEHGGVMLLDELDNGHPGLLAELNQALALGTCAFADRMVDAHPDFRLVATGNTYGAGGDRQYAGRQTLDSATLDRFVVIDVLIDEGLEERIALRHAPSHQDTTRDLLTRIRKLRATAADKNLPILFSPRASIDGAKLLEAGATVEQVIQWRVVRGLSAAHRKTLELD
jgi:MoxR-like ATPase